MRFKYINEAEVPGIIAATNGKYCNITFVKKDGTVRRLNGNLKVKVGVTGHGLAYNPADYNYVIIYDAKIGLFRTVNMSTVMRIVANKTAYIVLNENGVRKDVAYYQPEPWD